MKKTKKQHENEIARAILSAINDGFVVAVASDEEGNSYNTIETHDDLPVFYGDTNERSIVLGVMRHVDEEELFEQGMEKIEIETAEEARDYAIEWQKWASEQSLSYGELAEWGEYFTKLAERFDLVEEFKENGII